MNIPKKPKNAKKAKPNSKRATLRSDQNKTIENSPAPREEQAP